MGVVNINSQVRMLHCDRLGYTKENDVLHPIASIEAQEPCYNLAAMAIQHDANEQSVNNSAPYNDKNDPK